VALQTFVREWITPDQGSLPATRRQYTDHDGTLMTAIEARLSSEASPRRHEQHQAMTDTPQLGVRLEKKHPPRKKHPRGTWSTRSRR